MNQFFLVWRADGSPPLVPHKTYREAEDEAMRLASKHPGLEFHVLQSVATAQVVKPSIVTRHTPSTQPEF